MTTRSSSGITFAVDAVEPATELLTEWSMREAMSFDASPLVACHNADRQVVRTSTHPLLQAVHHAFSEHRPLVLSPDAVWITIAQGLGIHIHQNAEALRHDLVRHEGQLALVAVADTSPAWPDVIDQLARHIRAENPDLHDLFVCDFSTTGPVERTASLVVLMDAVRDYFSYAVRSICGIPTITLEGTPDDWKKLRARVERLPSYGMADWASHLLPLTNAFVATASGDVDLVFWQSICKLRRAYGGDIINGWIILLFPFLKDPISGEANRRSPFFEHPEETWRHDPESAPGITTRDVPQALSSAACCWTDAVTGTHRAMEFLGGLAAISQDPATLALRPEAGWAVREASPAVAVIARVLREAEVGAPVESEVLHARHYDRARRLFGSVPADLMRLYYATDGARLGDVRILRFEELSHVRGDEAGKGETSATHWIRFADLPDGTFLVTNERGTPRAALVAVGTTTTPGPHDQITVVAASVPELLTRLLDGGPTPYFQQPGFTPLAVAPWFDPAPISPTHPYALRWRAGHLQRLERLAAESAK